MITSLFPRRKRTRLNPDAYGIVGTICSVTVGVWGRRLLFSNGRAANVVVEALRRHALRTAVPIYGYCVMPDHLHLVLGPSPTCDIVTFVGQLKNLAQREVWRLGVRGRVWQAGFFDHFLRTEEQIERVVEYVLENPVREGLVKRRGDYPFSGSFVYDL